MNEFISKIIFPSIILLAAVVFTSSTFAAVKNNTLSTQSEQAPDISHSPMGCMSCHQSQSMQSEQLSKKKSQSQ
ncbi:MAG: hypothetical protein ACHP65_05000 [Legionellales bacterium]